MDLPDVRSLKELRERIVTCRRCPRLVRYREAVARKKVARFHEWEYWGRPLPGFGDPRARLLIVGLAPAAHGGNRTGRMFTGDRSGDWLYRALHKAGFANQPTSTARDDGLRLTDCYITAAVRCAPPQNRPSRAEFVRCAGFLERELTFLPRVGVTITLGHEAWNAFLRAWERLERVSPRPRPRFGHGAHVGLEGMILLGSYHPSQRNTQTGLLTEPMFDGIFDRARALLASLSHGD